MQTQTATANEFRLSAASRCKTVQDTMTQLVTVLLGNTKRFETVKPARWRCTVPGSDLEVETNYVYGEGTVRFYCGKSNTPCQVIKVRGAEGERRTLLTLLSREAFSRPAKPRLTN